MQRIPKSQLAQALNAALQADVGIQGLNTLLCGWKKYRRFSEKYCHALNSRDWLFITEVLDLSEYACRSLSEN